MTERLYYTDAYRRRFSARIVGRSDDGLRLYLDRTAFYPTSGGQPYDRGTIAGVAVRDVVDEEERIAHVVDRPVTSDDVECEVDWDRRFDLMQQHSGQHLLSALFADTFGFQTVSVHFGDELSTLDVGVAAVAPEKLRAVEARANEVIAENRLVALTFEDAATAAGLRKPSDRDGVLRIVSIDGIDRSACGGTHVRTTGEIGAVLLRRQEKVRQTTRIEFVCGRRAIRRARGDFEALLAMAQASSAAIDELPALFASQQAQLRAAEQAGRRLETDLATYRAREAHAGVVPDESGVRHIGHVLDDGAVESWRSYAIACSELPMTTCLVAARPARTVMLSASADSGIDAGAVLKAALAATGGRGGGSPRLAQGALPDAAAFEAAVRQLQQ